MARFMECLCFWVDVCFCKDAFVVPAATASWDFAEPTGLSPLGPVASAWNTGLTNEEATPSTGLDLWGWIALGIQR